MRFQALSLTTPSANIDGAVPATPTDFCFPCDVRYDYSGGGGAPSVPVAPAAPTFTGVERFVGPTPAPDTFSTLALAVAASNSGDIITVRAGYNSTETPLTTVTINKSLEIRGESRTTSQITGTAGSSGGNYVITIAAGTNNVWIHDLTITNLVTAAQDAGGISANIGAGTMTNLYPNGSTGLRFERLNLVHWKFGIAVAGAGWIINDCAFSCRLASAGTTIRHIGHYGQTGNCFVTNCSVTPTTDATPRSQFIYMTTNYAGNAQPYRPGQAGNLIIQNITTVGAGNYNAYYLQDVMHEPGLANVSGGAYTNPATPGSFSLWFDNTSFSNPYSGNPCSVLEATGQIAPLSFFDTLYFKDVVGAARTTGDNKGFFAVAGSTGTGRSIGAPVTGLYVSGTNTFGSVLPSATYAEGSTVDNLLGAVTTNFTVSSPIAPVPAASLSGLITVDGVTLLDGYRVFVVSTDPVESGIYSATSGAWYRTSDMAAGDDAAGDRFVVTQGTTYADTNWVCTNSPGNGVVDTDALSFSQYELGPAAPTYPTATGGTETTIIESGITYRVHTFTSSGTFTVTSTGTSGQVQYLIVGGGGAGGPGLANPSRPGCGGNAGQMLTGSTTVTAQAYAITIGDGGVGAYDSSGSASSALGLTATGGSVGASQNGPYAGTGASGGINGLQSSINGSSTYYAGAGGPAQWPPANAAGLGGGGAGAVPDSFGNGGQPGTANTGGGGGGGYGRSDPPSSRRSGGDGGSGIVIIRYPI